MSRIHYCEAVLICCGDHRLQQRKDGRNYVGNLMKFMDMDYDLVTKPGGIYDLADNEEMIKKYLLNDVSLYSGLHASNVIIMLNHEDCARYGFFRSRDEEFKKHFHDLYVAEKIIEREFPGKTIYQFFAELNPGSDDEFTIKQCGYNSIGLPRATGW